MENPTLKNAKNNLKIEKTMTTKKIKDQELVKSFVAGNQSSMEQLVKRHKDRVYTYIVMIVKDKMLAEDIFQETFIKVIKSLRRGKYSEKGVFVSWVIRIAHNLIIDHFRKTKHLQTISNGESEMDIFNVEKFSDKNIEDIIIQKQIENDVKKLIDELPEDQKEVVLLRHYGNLSFKEISDQTGVSINTALGRMRYALINLRKLMEDKKLDYVLF